MILTLPQRRALIALLGLVALVSATGLSAHLFHQPTLLKYAITVAAPLLLAALLADVNPLSLLTGLIVLAAPFAGYAVTVHGTHVLLLMPLFTLAAFAAALHDVGAARRSALHRAGVVMLAALLLPWLEASAPLGVLGTLISLFAAAYFAARACADERGFTRVLWAFVIAAAIQALLALWQRATGHQLNLYGSAGQQTFISGGYFFSYLDTTRPPGAFYDPISLGNMLAIAVPLAAGLITRYLRTRTWPGVLAAALALIVILAGLEATLDRMSWIGALAGLAAVLMLTPGRRRARIALGSALVIGAVVLLGGVGSQATLTQRASSILHPLNEISTGNGDQLRIEIWKVAVAQARAHPVAGIGLGRLQGVLADQLPPAGLYSHAHSTYLQLAAEGGILALIGLLVVLLALARDLRWIRAVDPLWGAALTGAALALLACWLTDVTVRYSGVATYMGIAFGMIAGRARLARAESEEPAGRPGVAG
jgi:O-antigen ligase